jgi:hypothetical protein
MILAFVIVAALVFAYFYQMTPIGILDRNAYAIMDGAMVANLRNYESGLEMETLEPVRIEELSMLYERTGAIYAGEEKIKLDTAFPLFLDEGAVIMSLDSNARLIADDFGMLSSYYGLYISGGISFNSDYQRADPDYFILYAMANQGYINVQPARIGSKEIPMNSVLVFSKDSISLYYLINGFFIYDRIEDLDEGSVINFNTRSYNYHDFLRALGIMAPLAPSSGQENMHIELPSDEELEEIEDGLSENYLLAVDQHEEILPERTREPSYRMPSVNLDKFSPDAVNMSVSAGLSVYDPLGAITSPIIISLRGDGYDETWQYSLSSSRSISDPILEIVTFLNLEGGKEYVAFGTYKYLNIDGVEQTQNFGLQRFVMVQRKEVDAPSLPPPAQPGDPHEFYVKPVVTGMPFAADVYYLSSGVDIHDPTSRIKGGVRFEIYRGSKLYMRRTIKESGEFSIGMLPPGESYRIVGSFTYHDLFGDMIDEEFLSETVSTISLSTL